MMEIKVCTTASLTEKEWQEYISGFNEVFEKQYTKEFFLHKYTSVDGGESVHSLLYEDGCIVGGCSVLPCVYMNGDKPMKIAVACDVFIKETNRTDPLALRRMYKSLKGELKNSGYAAVIAVPNATAYPYWKNIVKWKDVGKINYWMLPVKAGNILGRFRFLNLFSIIYSYSALVLSWIFPDNKSRIFQYRLSSASEFLSHRYDDHCKVYDDGKVFYSYKIVSEDGVSTAYVYTAENDGQRSLKAYRKAVKAILRHENVDIILYIGKLDLIQPLFIKVPGRFEPKLLPLTCDFVNEELCSDDMFDIDNWDFGLINYDVR